MSEYWINKYGQVDFADGDVGDQNHEGIVIDQVQRNIVDKCENTYSELKGFGNDEYVKWEEFLEALSEAYARRVAKFRPLFPKSFVKAQARDYPDDFIKSALKRAGVKNIEAEVAYGRSDARDYAMQYWGWKTYRDQNIDTWLLRPDDLKAIIEGIENITFEEGWSEKRLKRTQFTINVFSGGKTLNLTLDQMKNPKQTAQFSNPQTGNLINYSGGQASKQVRDMELQNIHPAYKRPGVNAFGDSVIHSFKTFIEHENA